MVLEKTFESSLDYQEIKPVHPKGNQSWIFIGRTDAKPEAPIFWPPDARSWLVGKDLDAGKDWRQEEKGTTEVVMIWWHHWLNELSLSKIREIMKDREAWCAPVHGFAKSWTRPSDWTKTTAFLMVQLSHPYMATWKTLALTIWIFVGKAMSLLFNTLSKVCHSFPSKGQEPFNFMAAVTICSDLWAQENKICHCYHLSPFYLPWRDGTKCHDLSFSNAEFQASFFTLLFHPHQEAL